MKAPILKRVAHWAKHDLASKNQPLGTGHLHEIIAALLGFHSHASFCQSDALEQTASSAAVIVDIDTELATTRCRTLAPDLDAELVVKRLCHVLEKASSQALMFSTGRETRATNDFVRQSVLKDPRMEGVVDDLEARVQAAVADGWADNEMYRSMAANSGPVTANRETASFWEGICTIEASGEYEDARGEDGSFELKAVFKQRWPRIYVLERVDLEFHPGVFDDLIVDQFGYIDE